MTISVHEKNREKKPTRILPEGDGGRGPAAASRTSGADEHTGQVLPEGAEAGASCRRGDAGCCGGHAAVQAPTLGEMLAEATVRSGAGLGERIANGHRLGISWAAMRAVLTLELDRRQRAGRAYCALFGTGATIVPCPCLMCSRRTASCACVMFEALACCEHTLDIECCQTRVEAKPARSAREGCVGAWYDRDPTSAWSPFPRTPFVRMKPRGPPAVVPVSTRRAVLSERRAVQMGKCRGMCSSYRWVETQGLGA